MKVKKWLASALVAFASIAQADVIEFAGPSRTVNGALTEDGVTFTSDSGRFFVFAPGDFGYFDDGGICALQATAFSCEASFTMDFGGAVSDIAFISRGWDFGDSVLVTGFNGSTNVGSFSVASDGSFAFGSTVTSLRFQDSSVGGGVGVGNFSFTRGSNQVPEPGTLLLGSLALGALALTRRGRK